MLSSGMIRRATGWTLVVLLVLSLITWWSTRDRLPASIRISTALEGGQYHRLGELLAATLADNAEALQLTTRPSLGTVENRQRLLDGEAELGLFQAGAAPLTDLAVLAPLHRDVAHLIVRKSLGVSGLDDLTGRRLSIGPEGSGMKRLALKILEHHGLLASVDTSETYFLALRDDASLDGAIVTTGLLNDDLGSLLASRDYALLPILDAPALGIKHPFLVPLTIPRGLYGENPALPPHDLPTVSTDALLVARADASDAVVNAALGALYQGSIHHFMPTVQGRAQAATWTATPLHPAAARFFDPYRGVGVFASFMESLAAAKELVFALLAGIYLIWSRWNQLKDAERARLLRDQKDRLDGLLDRTVAIERAQMDETEREVLERHLDDVTLIKLEALEELSHEDLRGDRTFLIFLTQCAALIAKLQLKIEGTSLA